MRSLHVCATAVAFTAVAAATAAPATAQGRLDGAFTFVNGPTTNQWYITSQCNPEGVCAGTVTTSTGVIAHIGRTADGPWTVSRHDVPNGWICPDGSTAPGDQTYTFDPVTLAGTLSATSRPGACGNPEPAHMEQPISLHPA
ncbi:putative secreted protein [Mycolicibacterium phlei]|jgi:hypothetical protein|uniref:Secreted protein n=1 Tax=Mycolicibacterium phlei DSM 43239 = CCUG 21000 TaxID=1226750 RepID=A0A5N5V5Y5_MYCPH|nr:hypothetical protein [Mycolicibacterium phlei]VEG07271.1 putative secreted protein [Mycobacteroides chelonae]AMO59139.1 hypothetical protein MPHLCCUG_00297 [Mycolicibacterium phlei]EID17492.1 hypothetical protein MPHLEI_03583 [Mycolicibacterium phlei RIVM601174]KAB7757148.1 hypothetical protein MPHL21000_08090 [Mycolicibacterium phlei DSM 43239 = CCUG 21000]KXW64991.1 hypothetical protein MPHL43239_10180 [Mycolicibacterium phlei DSM 43239 = CCUG 21000]